MNVLAIAVSVLLQFYFGSLSTDHASLQWFSVPTLPVASGLTLQKKLELLVLALHLIYMSQYEKCMPQSHNYLFGSARVMMAAALVSFQNLLRRSIPQGGPSSSSPIHVGGPLYATWWSSESWVRCWSRESVVFFSLASLVALVWTIGELVGYLTGALEGNVWLSFGSICVNVTLFVGIMMFLASGASENGKEDSQNPIFFFRW